ncbi:MAG: hypothetical protein [Bacteriophage sp.]|nr:MAG: hypothetical protein [Bacteriophage sp.]
MSESKKFTPGPWNNMPKTEYVPICKQDEAGLALGFINSTNLERTAEGKANAYLIAAAPDLLEALEKALDALAHCRADIGYSSMQTRTAHTADKAIKKARGQQ